MGKLTILTGPCSLAMSNYQRVRSSLKPIRWVNNADADADEARNGIRPSTVKVNLTHVLLDKISVILLLNNGSGSRFFFPRWERHNW